MLEELKQEVWEANLALHRSGLVMLTFGNVSGRDRSRGLVAIKPSGVSYEAMRPHDIVIVDLAGRVVEGELRPSSDTPTHVELYRQFEEIHGVAHTHSSYATAWAQARRPLPCLGTTHADSFRGAVPVTDELPSDALEGDYERETGRWIARTFRDLDPHQIPGVLVASHGPFTWGKSPAEAVENSVILEQIARMAALAESLNPQVTPISKGLADKHFLRKHGKGAYYGQK